MMTSRDTDIDEARDIFESDERKSKGKQEKLTDKELEEKYDSGLFNVVTEKSDFLLPQIQDFVEKRQWINLKPEYQRRKRWDNGKKSRLIESLLVNVPIPPVFLYEQDLARYEVMDGQQRLNAIIEFYNNDLKLSGLELWESLNGKTYSQCPPRIQRGIDRRRISAVVLQAESESSELASDRLRLRRLVFQRLNTGGEKLNPQELRNALFGGPFNEMLIELSRLQKFTATWQIPSYDDFERTDGFVGEPRKSNTLYRTMGDCQIVLRFFAFRERSKVSGSVQSILDRQMVSGGSLDRGSLDDLKSIFASRLSLAVDIFGRRTFRLPPKKGRPGKGRLSMPLYDAVMIALDQLWARGDELVSNKKHISDRLWGLLGDEDSEFYEVVVGRPNTAKSILDRIARVKDSIALSL